MGIFGAIAEGVVAIKYDVDVDDAVKAVKGLSGEQKKAAKQAVEAHKQEREAFKKNVEEFGKGAAIIGGALLVARNGLQAYREESRLMAGAAGVDIGELSDAYDGLRTRTELLTLAQAGHQGAWKLTTAQIENVIGGMRALEKKGFDSQQVFEKFTDVIKKGKLEGLDDFGLSLKATGDQTQDLKVLMSALGREVLDVGGNFEKAGDASTRAIARMEDGLTNLRTSVGWLTDKFLGLGVAIGDALGKAVFGDLPTDTGTGARAGVYTDAFARLGGGAQLDGTRSRGAFAQVTGADSWFTFADRKLFKGATDADRLAGQTLSTFKSALNKGMSGWGPLATTSPEEFAKIVTGLPEGWRAVDKELGKRVDAFGDKLQEKFRDNVAKAGQGILDGFEAAWNTNAARHKTAQRKAGAAAAAKHRRTLVDKLSDGYDAFMGLAAFEAAKQSEERDFAAQQKAGAAASQSILDASRNAGMQSDFADARDALAKMQEEFAGVTRAAELNKADEESFLAKTFGPLEEFDQYAAGFATLKGAVTDGFAAWIDGSESLGTAIQKSIAGSLRAYAIEMSGKALVAGANALYLLAEGRIPEAAAMGASALKYTAAAAGLGVLAKSLGGSGGGSSVASSAAGIPSTRPSNDNGGTSGVVIVGDPLSDDSPRERQRRVRRAMNAANRGQNSGVRYG